MCEQKLIKGGIIIPLKMAWGKKILPLEEYIPPPETSQMKGYRNCAYNLQLNAPKIRKQLKCFLEILKKHVMHTRNPETCKVQSANTERFNSFSLASGCPSQGSENFLWRLTKKQERIQYVVQRPTPSVCHNAGKFLLVSMGD